MIPIGDDNRDRILTPYVNYVLIAINVLVFVFLQGMGSNGRFTYAFATVPQEILTGEDLVTDDRTLQDPLSGDTFTIPGLQPTPISPYITLLTSMFMHGGFAHLLGNLLYLWIFGDNLEDRMGHGRYLGFYLLCGLLASLAHVYSSSLFGNNLLIPSLGASGAISGVLAATCSCFPTAGLPSSSFASLPTCGHCGQWDCGLSSNSSADWVSWAKARRRGGWLMPPTLVALLLACCWCASLYSSGMNVNGRI